MGLKHRYVQYNLPSRFNNNIGRAMRDRSTDTLVLRSTLQAPTNRQTRNSSKIL